MKDFTLYPEALALRELGFDEPCFGYFRDGKLSGVNKWDRKDWEFHIISNKDITNITHEIVLAPTYSQAFRWFREKHHLIGTIEYVGGAKYETTWWDICVVGHFNVNPSEWTMKYQPYEQAELACLQKLIEIVKNKAI